MRVDSGVDEGDEIPIFYDPIISKVVAHAENRELAIAKLNAALEEYVIRGVGHNTNFCRDILKDQNFKSGNYNTGFIEKTYPEGFKFSTLQDADLRHLAEVAAVLFRTREKLDPTKDCHFVVELRDKFWSCYLQGDKITSGTITFDKHIPGEVSTRTMK